MQPGRQSCVLNTRPNGVMQRKKYNPLAVIIFLLGLGILAAAIVKSRMTGLAEESSMAATGIAVMIGSFLLQLIWPLRVYVLVLRTSSGDVDAIMSRNKEFVSNVQKAVEQACVRYMMSSSTTWSLPTVREIRSMRVSTGILLCILIRSGKSRSA